MNSYTDIQVVECNRLHSEEAKSGNDENFALWTNNLQDILHLEAGDKVSVFGAMINEKGAGGETIEIKGVETGVKKTFNFTEVQYLNASNFLSSGYDTIECNASSKNINIRDDTLVFNQSYYQTATGSNYIHLPRKWWYKVGDTSDEQWSSGDSEDAGLSRHFVNFETDHFSLKSMYYVIDLRDEDAQEDQRLMKPKNDNKRYTIMMRDISYFSYDATENLPPFNEGQRDPENTIYRTYKELKEIVVPKGFNSPDYLAGEISRQFQKINEEKIWAHGYDHNAVDPLFHETPTPYYRTIATESYKPFNVACLFRKQDNGTSFNMIENAFKEYYVENASSTNASGWDYLSQYHLVACDKPDLYEAGRLINEEFNVFGQNTYTGIGGARLKYDWGNDTNYIVLDISYNKDFCDKFKNFIDVQSTYPEIWDMFKETDNDYNSADNINNSRWVHINRWSNASMTNADPDNAMLGHSYYTYKDWNAENRYKILNSLLLPINYDPEQKDQFYEYNASFSLVSQNKFSYGCISSTIEGLVIIKATENNGVGTPVYTELLSYIAGESPVPTNIEAGRKIGFDMHFNAPGLSWILPYAGYAQVETSFDPNKSHADYNLPNIETDSTLLTYGYTYVNKLYFGATTPQLNWDGTNFSFSGLHTPLNRGQDVRSKDPNFTDYPDKTDLASDIVYKINPIELMQDWTPDRKPYRKDPISGIPATHKTLALNENLLPWWIYDSSTGIFLSDFNLTENEWKSSLWNILGFSYKQFNSKQNNRLIKTDNKNVKNLQLVTTNAEIGQADSKVYVQNMWGAPMYNNMMPMSGHIKGAVYPGTEQQVPYYAPIIQKTESIQIISDNLPTRMIRGYYGIRSDILSQAPFIGGKTNNTTMPICGVVDKINGDGDFYFGSESSLAFTCLKPLRLASIKCSVHDPDGSYANCGDQSTILFKIEKNKNVSFNIIQEILEQEQQKSKPKTV